MPKPACILFLGFKVVSTFADSLAKAPQPLQDMLISQGVNPAEEYLSAVTFENQRYLGKHLTEITPVSSLELLETHIFSLLKKLVPDYAYNSGQLNLLSFISPS